jgi:hypothetical protein
VAGFDNQNVIPLEVRVHGWEERWNFELRVAYEDVAGQKWETVARYLAEHLRYEDVRVTTLVGT